MSDEPNKHIQRGQREEEILILRTENQFLRKQLEHERSEREAAQRTIARLGGGIDEEPETITCANTKCLKKSPRHRCNQLYCSDRCKLTVQKRRARAKSKQCSSETCTAQIRGKRKNAVYCSSRCKSAAGVRRHRAKSVGGAS